MGGEMVFGGFVGYEEGGGCGGLCEMVWCVGFG